MDISPRLSRADTLIASYGGGAFTIRGERIQGSVLLFPGRLLPWSATSAADITEASLAHVLADEPPPELLLLGTGRTTTPMPLSLRQALGTRRIAMEAMDTGAACRTYNILLGEDRRVAAALIAV